MCSLDKSLQESGIQMALYEHIGKYLKPDAEGFEAFFTGELLCIVALVCWYLMVAKERIRIILRSISPYKNHIYSYHHSWHETPLLVYSL